METHSESVTFTSLSPRWAAPEVIRLGRRHLTTCSDVFSYARTVVEVGLRIAFHSNVIADR